MRKDKNFTGETDFQRNIDWNLFALFYEIARTGGVSAAARYLNRQQPTVSAGLKRLEDHLGMPLVERTSQGVELLPAGRALLAQCDAMMKAVRSVPHHVAVAAGTIEGVIQVRMISSVVAPDFDEALRAFHQAHPGVRIHLEVTPWRSVVKSLLEGEAEVGIACDSAPSSELCYEPLVNEVPQLYCSRNHPLYGQIFSLPADLADQAMVLTGADEPEELTQFRRRYGLGRVSAGLAENLHEAKRLIELGIGIGFIPTCVIGTLDPEKQLWPLLPEPLLPSHQVFLITRDRPARNTPTELFLGEIMSRLRKT